MRAIARHWAHADVARAMRTQCARCVLRLRQRLGDAAVDLGPAASAVRLPERRLHGAIASSATTLLGEQGGGPTGPGELQAHLDYWTALNAAVLGALSRGDDATMLPAALPGIDASLTSGHAHALNWQRAWRHAEDKALQPQPRGSFQRSLR